MDFDNMPWDGIGVISGLRERAGTPLLLGPEGIAPADTPDGADPDSGGTTAPVDDTEATSAAAKSERSKPSSTISASSLGMSSTATEISRSGEFTESDSSSANFPSASSSTLSSAIPSIPQDKVLIDDASSVQLSSLAYLVPVFLLIAITIGAIVYRRYRARKKLDRESSKTFESPTPAPRGVGWREIKNTDTDEKDDIWNDDSDPEDEMEEQWRKVQFKESKSRPGLLDVSTTAGWLRSAAWKSARSINAEDDQQDVGGKKQQKTVKLVTRSAPTYESLLPGQQPHSNKPAPPSPSSPGRFGSLRAIRDSLSSFSLATITGRLERNKSPNKRYSRSQPFAPPPPEEPAWIRPRAASPINMLSPPSQPHFFFQSTPAQSMVLHRAQPSESEYTVTDTESLLSNIPQSASKQDAADHRPVFTRGQANLGADLHRTPSKASTSSRKPTRGESPGKTPTMRRSSAVRNLAESLPGRHKTARDGTAARKPQSPESVRKSKKQIKDEKARQRVETILQASWSDRALSSPSASLNSLASPPDANTKFPGWASPGVEQVGGIQARLALLKSMETEA